MKRSTLIFIVLTGFCTSLYGQNNIPDSLALLFYKQLDIFPQEKLYLHTDKPYYLSGEKIWFRAYLADAITHVPSSVSRYVYVELINPLDSVVVRVKIRPIEEAFYGHLLIPDNVPEGNYTLRAYTTFMRSLEEDYFFNKTLYIGDPQASTIDFEPRFFYESGNRMRASFQFSNWKNGEPLSPTSVKVSINGGRSIIANVDNDGVARVNFNLPTASLKRVMLIEVIRDRKPYSTFITIPVPDNDFDLSFYPEGGSLMAGTPGKVAFKAMKSNGQAMKISGTIYNDVGEEVSTFESDQLGMGSFLFIAQKGEVYSAVCENDYGESKRFVLPSAVDYGYSLSVSHVRNNIYVSVCKPVDVIQNEELTLFAHTRGIVHYISPWDHQKNLAVIPKDSLPSGVLHLILFDSALNPVSERLVFINNKDQALVESEADVTSHTPRSLVKNRVSITDHQGQPLVGTFSLAITSDKVIQPDTTTHILTQLLLTSDLRGYIENPAYYFNQTSESERALDLLMLTQGWRRYNVTAWSQGNFSKPTSPLEIGTEISGTVKSLLLGNPVEDVEVNVFSLNGDYFNTTQTDKEGRFYLSGGELRDSTQFMVGVVPKRGMTRMNLVPDLETFPEIKLSPTPSFGVERTLFAQYADKAELQYIYEGGIRAILLQELVVTAKPSRKQYYYGEPSNYISEEEIDKVHAIGILQLLQRLPGLQVSGNSVRIRGEGTITNYAEPLILVDNIPIDNDFLDMILVNDVAQIDVFKGPDAAFWGVRGGNGVIVIHLKETYSINNITSQPFHIKTLLPLGYQQPVEFYAPKYETDEQRYNPRPDLRTTIYWQPVIQIDSSGITSFEFYTADEPTSYTMVIEGLAADGTIIRHYTKLLNQ